MIAGEASAQKAIDLIATRIGFVGGILDNAQMRFLDALYGLPYLPFAIITLQIFGNVNFSAMVVARTPPAMIGRSIPSTTSPARRENPSRPSPGLRVQHTTASQRTPNGVTLIPRSNRTSFSS